MCPIDERRDRVRQQRSMKERKKERRGIIIPLLSLIEAGCSVFIIIINLYV